MSIAEPRSEFDLAADEIRGVILREISGDEDAREELEGDLREWRDALVEFIQDIDGQFAHRRAEASEMKAQCLRDDTAPEWFRYDAAWADWRGRANGLKRRLVAKLSEVKALIHDDAQQGNVARRDALDEILRSLRRIEAHLGIGP